MSDERRKTSPRESGTYPVVCRKSWGLFDSTLSSLLFVENPRLSEDLTSALAVQGCCSIRIIGTADQALEAARSMPCLGSLMVSLEQRHGLGEVVARTLSRTWLSPPTLLFSMRRLHLTERASYPDSVRFARLPNLVAALVEHHRQGLALRGRQFDSAVAFAERHGLTRLQTSMVGLVAVGVAEGALAERLNQSPRSFNKMRSRLYRQAGIEGYAALVQHLAQLVHLQPLRSGATPAEASTDDSSDFG